MVWENQFCLCQENGTWNLFSCLGNWSLQKTEIHLNVAHCFTEKCMVCYGGDNVASFGKKGV